MKTARWEKAASRILLAAALVAAGGEAVVQAADTTGGAAVGLPPQTVPAPQVVLKSRTTARQLARMYYFDKMAEAEPGLVAAVCSDAWAARILADSPRLDRVADADHFLCRRLTQWPGATEVLLRNPHLDRVIELDPQGIYWAMERRPAYARVLSGHVLFYKMCTDNPDLGRVVASYIPSKGSALER